jgi:hypothetical protein
MGAMGATGGRGRLGIAGVGIQGRRGPHGRDGPRGTQGAQGVVGVQGGAGDPQFRITEGIEAGAVAPSSHGLADASLNFIVVSPTFASILEHVFTTNDDGLGVRNFHIGWRFEYTDFGDEVGAALESRKRSLLKRGRQGVRGFPGVQGPRGFQGADGANADYHECFVRAQVLFDGDVVWETANPMRASTETGFTVVALDPATTHTVTLAIASYEGKSRVGIRRSAIESFTLEEISDGSDSSYSSEKEE